MKAEENTSIPGTESNKPEARPAAPLQALKPEPAKGKKTSALQGMVRQIALALLFVTGTLTVNEPSPVISGRSIVSAP